jgi:hypothetical protein
MIFKLIYILTYNMKLYFYIIHYHIYMINFLINMKRKACFSRQLNPTLKAHPLKSLKIQPMPKIVGVVDIVTQ